jgi:hypothetical protein
VAHLGSRSAGQVRIVHGQSAAEGVPRSRCIPMCNMPAWRGVRLTCTSVEAKVARYRGVSCLRKGERGGLCAGV